MKRFITYLLITIFTLCFISISADAGIQKPVLKNAVIADEGIQPDQPQVAENHSYTVYPAAKIKDSPWMTDKKIGPLGSGGDYETFADALIDLYTNGIGADVSILVLGDYVANIYGEVFPITFRATFTGAETYKLTVKPAPGATASITNNNAISGTAALVVLDSMRNMEFDGNNGTSDYNLSIVWNGARGATGRSVNLWNSVHNVTFKNMVFKTSCGGSSPNFRNVDVSGKNTANGGIQNIEFNNCKFLDNGTDGPEYHLYISGYAAFQLSSNINVRHCIFKNANGLGSYWGAGIQVRYGVSDCVFEYNDFTYDAAFPMNGGSTGIYVGGSSDAMRNITIRNNNVHDMVTSVAGTLCAGIAVQGPTATTTGCFAPTGIVIDNNTISNIFSAGGLVGTFSMNAPWGIRASGSGNGIQITNNHISNLGISDATVGTQPMGISVSFTATSVYLPKNVHVVGNTIDGIHGNGTTGSTFVLGIRVGGGDSIYVLKNKIKDITATDAAKAIVGLAVWGSSGKTWYQQYANNFISLATPNATRADAFAMGIQDWAYAGNTNEYFYNSVYMGGTSVGTEWSYSFYGYAAVSNRILKNNIFFNERENTGTAGNAAIGDDSLAMAALFSDYNDYYAPSVNSGMVGNIGSAFAFTIPELAALMQSGQDVNDKSEEPHFVDKLGGDFHIKIGTATGLDNTGTPVSVTDDIDGEARGTGKLAPDIGADEFEAGAPGAFALLTPINSATNVPINGSLTWGAAQSAYSYDVYLDTLSPGSFIGNVTGTSYSYAGLKGNRQYFWKIVAKNDIDSTDATGSPFTFTTALLPPLSPSDVSFTNVSTTGLEVNWNDNSSDETGFNIYKATAIAGPYTLEGSVLADVKVFPVTGLSASVRYFFKVTAYHTVQGESDPALGNVATLANVPVAPSALTIRKRGMNLKILTGDDNSDSTLYAIYDETTSKYVSSKTISGVYTYYFLGATPVWRTRLDWGPFTGTLVVDLLPSSNYVWKAKAKNTDGVETAFGPTVSTTTQDPLSVFPVIEGFESTTFPPTDWGRIDIANDGTVDGSTTPATFYGMWGRAATTTYRGGGCARYLWEQTLVNGADDWLINQPMTLQAGTSYIVSFYIRTSTANEAMTVTIGTEPTPAAQTTILANYDPLYSTSYMFKGIVFTVPTTGTYYIGFHANTPTNQLWIRMDDIKVAVANPTDVAFLGITQTTGLRPMKAANIGSKTSEEKASAIPLDRSGIRPASLYKISNVNNTLLVDGPVNTNYVLQGFIGEDAIAEAFNSDNGILKVVPSTVNLRAQLANIGVNSIPSFTIDYTVDGIAQPPYSGGVIPPGSDVIANILYVPTDRGMFSTVATANVVGEGDRSNDTGRVDLMVYPIPAYNIRYDDYYGTPYYGWGTSTPNDTFRIVIGMRYSNPQRGRISQIDITTKSNRRVGSTYLNVAIPDVWRVRIRAASADTNIPGPILYEKKFEGPKYNTVATTLKTMPFGDDAPVIEAGQDFWITVMAESAGVTTGGYPFGLFDGVNDVSHLLPGASYRSYGSDYLDEHSWYAMDASVMGAGDFGHWALRSIMVPVSNSISGMVYNDLNGNGSKDISEPALQNWEVKLSGGISLSTLTDVNGVYAFNNLENATFTLSETIPLGWHCLTPDSTGSYTVTLAGNESQVRDFGNYQGVKPGVFDENIVATEYRLYQNYPNPFNPNATIRFSIADKGSVVLRIYDMLGREIKTLVDEVLNPGTYKISFDGSAFASGMYYYRIETTSVTGLSKTFTEVKKMLLIK
jgi:hypothetical protein